MNRQGLVNVLREVGTFGEFSYIPPALRAEAREAVQIGLLEMHPEREWMARLTDIGREVYVALEIGGNE